MGTVVFILVLIVIVLAFAIFGDDLFERLVNFFFGFVFISMGVIIVGLILFLMYTVLTSIFGQ